MNANDMFVKPGHASGATMSQPTLSDRLTKVLLTLARVLALFSLVAMSLFCVFGFLASFEPGNSVIWKIGYGTPVCCFLLGASAVLRSRSRNV